MAIRVKPMLYTNVNEVLFTKQHPRIILSHYLPLDSAFEIAKTVFVNYTSLICTQVIKLKLKGGKTLECEEVVPMDEDT